MKILYTYFGLMQRVGGVSRYFYENIVRISNKLDVKVCSLFCSNEYFKDYLHRPWFSPKHQMLIYVKLVLEEAFLWMNLKFTNYDLVHITADRLSVYRWTSKPIVTTIHDMIPELLHTNPKTIERRKQSIIKSSAIICVSENTKRDLLRIYPELPESKVRVIYHGYDVHRYTYRHVYEFPYILYVGTRREPYKNFIPFVTAVAPLLKRLNLKLVCTGERFNEFERQRFLSLGISDNLVESGYVSENQLANLYHYAECFVFPSKYEGFGIPILEAFCHGTAACISNTSCFPEVGGDAVAYFNPNDASSIAECVGKVLEDKKYRQLLINKGLDRLKEFTWDRAAEKHIEFYNYVINRARQ